MSDEIIHKLAKEIEREFKVPYEFAEELLSLEATHMHHPKRSGVVKRILEMLDKDYWKGVEV